MKPIDPEIYEALEQLPGFSRKIYPEQIAHVMLANDVHDWQWFLSEYSRKRKWARGLVKGLVVEYGDFDFTPPPESILEQGLHFGMATYKLRLVRNFVPCTIGEIEQKLARGEPLEFAETKSELLHQRHYDIFVSYAAEDEDFVSKFVVGLELFGLRVWYAPAQSQIGDKLPVELPEAISKCYTFLPVFSPIYFEKRWTQFEFNTFFEKKAPDQIVYPLL